jgi:hypothetical protein
MDRLNISMDTQLTIADMASLKQILEAGCARGMFRANEMTTVGVLYDKLSVFVETTQRQMAEAQEQDDEAPTIGEAQ